jgi:hypothetical protein
LRFGSHFTVNRPFQRYDSQLEARRKIIVQLFALSRVVAGSRHLLNATLDIEAAKLGDARIAPGSIDQSICVYSQMLSILDDIWQFVETRPDSMGFMFSWLTFCFD